MRARVFIQSRYISRHSLLDAMAEELHAAFEGCGHEASGSLETIAPSMSEDARLTIGLLFNFPASYDQLPPMIRQRTSPCSLIQFFVDHPLALASSMIDRLVELPHYRLVLPCIDSAHLLAMRWPGLRSTHCPHAVPASSLCDETSMARRHVDTPSNRQADESMDDLVLTGSIHTVDEIEQLRRTIPTVYKAAYRSIVEQLVEEPHCTFEAAADVALTPLGLRSGDWNVLAGLWRPITAEVNRVRRLTMLQAMQGVGTVVYGGPAWREHCTGSIRYGGEVAYGELPAVLRRARVCLAWGPTQFAHTFSERLLLSMAAGCATVADDRRMIKQHFKTRGDGAEAWCFDPARPVHARELVERLLADAGARSRLAVQGRVAVQRRHLWAHRVNLLLAVAADASAGRAIAKAA